MSWTELTPPPVSARGQLCCMEYAKQVLAPTRDQLVYTDANGLPEIAHTIERFDPIATLVLRRAGSVTLTCNKRR